MYWRMRMGNMKRQSRGWGGKQMGLPVFCGGKDEIAKAECRKKRVVDAAHKMWELHYMMRNMTEMERRKYA
jgi:hypothetical protein